MSNHSINIEREFDDEGEIKKYFNTEKKLLEFVKEEMIVWSEYNNNRKKYKNGDFNIDIDNLDFGYSLVEIELMVEKEEHAKEAEEKIINFANKYNFNMDKVPSKGEKYFEIVKPEIYKQIWGDR